uniref:Type I polyketide sythase n=1 Tax=Gambierdiscus polynesiensis TaxID=439318 RepID=A0A6M5KDL3_9DINO|nr:type I polyketide sythase [Gambierdiscus polynesiensis]
MTRPLPSQQELVWIQTVDHAKAHAGTSSAAWNAIDLFLGGIGQNLRLFGLLGREGVQQALKEARVKESATSDERPLNVDEMGQVALMWRVSRQKLGLPDEDPTPEEEENLWLLPPGVTARRSKYLAWSGDMGVKSAPKKPVPARKPPPAPVPPRLPADLSWNIERSVRGSLAVKGHSYVEGCEHLRSIFHNGYDAATKIPLLRWDGDTYYEPDPPAWNRAAIYTRHGVFLDLPDAVDYTFFGITAADAKLMDPMQRSCLKQGYRAFVSAKLTRHALRGSLTGVYAGSMNFDWLMDLTGILDRGNMSMLANRIGCALGLSGPGVYIDTGCSSSLVTADMAATHVRRGKIQTGLALGVNALLSPQMYAVRCAGSLLSKVGRSASFDSNSDGYVVGEGCGGVVIGYTDKIEESTPLWIASETMQDGRSAQLTAPSGPAQGELLKNTMRRARVSAPEIAASECQCNGSHLGDPIELGSLEKFHRAAGRNDSLMCLAGKTNKGHGEGNAGMTVLMKTILLVEDHILPPVLHFNKLNPHIDIEGMPFYFVSETSLLPHADKYHISGSAFGWGGVNAHFVWQSEMPKQQLPAQPQYGTMMPQFFPPMQMAAGSTQVQQDPLAGGQEEQARSGQVAVSEKEGLDLGMVRNMIMETAMNVNDGEQLEMDSSLMESGIDSLAAITFRNELQRKSGLNLKGTLMFDYPTMSEIANHIVELSNG